MSYSEFNSVGKVKKAFNLTTIEDQSFLNNITPIAPSHTLQDFLSESLPLIPR